MPRASRGERRVFAAGEGQVRHLGEQVEARTGLAGDGLTEQLAGQVRGIHPHGPSRPGRNTR